MTGKRIPWNKGKTTPLEVRLKQSLRKKGKPSPRKGVILSQDQKNKISVGNKGHIAWNRGIPCSNETKIKLSLSKKGSKAWNKGIILPDLDGRTRSYKRNYRLRHSKRVLENAIKYAQRCGKSFNLNSDQYRFALREWSLAVRNLNNKCVICGEKACESHHIIHKKYYPELSLNLNNGISLCLIHHKQAHGNKLI